MWKPAIGDLVRVPIFYTKSNKYGDRRAIMGFAIYFGGVQNKFEWEEEPIMHLVFIQNRSEYAHYSLSEIHPIL